MSAFFDYARNITYYLLFFTLVNLAAPGGRYKAYVRLVTGLVLICLLIQPLRALVNGGGFPVTELFSQVIPKSSVSLPEGYEGWRYETVKAAFDEQVFAQLESLLQPQGYVLKSVMLECTEDFGTLTNLMAEVSEKKAASKPFIRIEPIDIASETESDDAARIKKLIADFYNMSMDNIHVKIARD